ATIQRSVRMLFRSTRFERHVANDVLALVQFDLRRLRKQVLCGLLTVGALRTGNDQPILARTKSSEAVALSALDASHVVVDVFDAVGEYDHGAAGWLAVVARYSALDRRPV